VALGIFLCWLYGPDFPAPARAPDPRAPALVRALGADSFREREAAQDALARMGAGARLALEGARGSPDPEVRRRAREVLARRPGTLDEEVGWWPQLDLLWYDDRGEMLGWPLPWHLAWVKSWLQGDYLDRPGDGEAEADTTYAHYADACRRLAHDLHGRGVPRRLLLAAVRRLQRREAAWAARYLGGRP
jgi:GNAT superfamily N-acetyltransferase